MYKQRGGRQCILADIREDNVSGLFSGHALSLDHIKKRHAWEKERLRESKREREREEDFLLSPETMQMSCA